MTRSADILYQVQVAVLNVEQSIENHALLCQEQIKVQAWQASRDIHHMLERFKLEDQFARRSAGQRRRWFLIKQGRGK